MSDFDHTARAWRCMSDARLYCPDERCPLNDLHHSGPECARLRGWRFVRLDEGALDIGIIEEPKAS